MRLQQKKLLKNQKKKRRLNSSSSQPKTDAWANAHASVDVMGVLSYYKDIADAPTSGVADA